MLAEIPPPPIDALELGPLTFHLYGLAMGVGILLAILLTRRRYAGMGLDPEPVDKVALLSVLAGVVGARLGFVVWRLDRFVDRPAAVLAVWEGGLVLFGGLLFGVVTAFLLTRAYRMRTPAFADAAAPAIPLAHSIGRWGNYFNQELYGLPTDLPWALRVEADQRVAGFEGYETFHPTFLYESLLNLVLVGVLLAIDRYGSLKRGALLFAYLAGYGAIRFGVELLRIDTDYRLLGLSRNSWAFLLVSLLGITLLVWWQRRRQR